MLRIIMPLIVLMLTRHYFYIIYIQLSFAILRLHISCKLCYNSCSLGMIRI